MSKAKITSKDIQRALRSFYVNHEYRLSNTYIFAWESDFFCMAKSSGYFYEVEIKVSKGDFKADFAKDKHKLLRQHKVPALVEKTSLKGYCILDGKEVQAYSGVLFRKPAFQIPNRFYYACPEGLLKSSDMPEYAGLLWYSKGWITKIKEAPLLHKNNLLLRKKAILLDKFYWLSENKIRDYNILKREHERTLEHNEKFLYILKKMNINPWLWDEAETTGPEKSSQNSKTNTMNNNYLSPAAFPIENGKVFPSEEQTVFTNPDKEYGGAHRYELKNCLGFNNGKTEYVPAVQSIQFIQKADDGSIIPGVQSEQLVLALIDRHKKLNARFPSPQNEKMIAGLTMFLEACKERVQDRMNRGVMGDLKK